MVPREIPQGSQRRGHVIRRPVSDEHFCLTVTEQVREIADRAESRSDILHKYYSTLLRVYKEPLAAYLLSHTLSAAAAATRDFRTGFRGADHRSDKMTRTVALRRANQSYPLAWSRGVNVKTFLLWPDVSM